jgi:8-oxo-dGTP pyrophosphatase MutT (NUDIX family)
VRWPERRVGAAAVVLDDSGQVLLVRHTYGRFNWELPGGASEPGETVAETALRELREETSLEAAAERLIGIYYDRETDAHHFVFRCRVLAGEATPSSDEVSDVGYWAPDALPRPISDFTLRRIEDALSGTFGALPVAVPPRRWLD